MRKLRTVLAAAAVATAAAAFVAVASEWRLRRAYAVEVPQGKSDPSLVAEGEHLARSRGCADCHGPDFRGRVLADDALFGRLAADNLTRRPPGHPDATTRERTFRALRHGVDLDSRSLLMMPSRVFSTLSTREIDAIAAYLDTLPPGGDDMPDSRLGPLGRTLLAFGQLDDFLPAEAIDHARPPLAAPPPVGTLDYGRHFAQLCTGCHGADFAGGPPKHGSRAAAANLTPQAGGLAAWSERDFVQALRTGTRPDGRMLDERAMPWGAIGLASDAELHSIWLFLRSLPPTAHGPR